MGYNTAFQGAFRITPKVNAVLAYRINLWLKSRHYVRPYDGSDPTNTTLFGFPGDNKQFVIPSLRNAVLQTIANGYDPAVAVHMIEPVDDFCPLNNEEVLNYNTTPEGIPSLWSDIIIVNSPKSDESYLMWNGNEKTYHFDAWAERIAGFLCQCGYTVDGCLTAQGEDAGDTWFMTFCDGNFERHQGWKEPTYDAKAKTAEKNSRAAAKKALTRTKDEIVAIADGRADEQDLLRQIMNRLHK